MRTALYDDETHEFLGYLVNDNGSWSAQTVFGYTIERTASKEAAEHIIREQGLVYLKGVWQYFDKDEDNWFSCTISGATEHQVTVIRTNELGYQVPELYKMSILKDPDENTLVKSA